MKSKEASIAIIVALIGLCGVLGAAAINNWDKIFGTPTPVTAPPPTKPPSADSVPEHPNVTCGGTDLEGACWYFGGENLSCEMVCSSHGGYNDATRNYAGSDGTSANCQNVLNKLSIPLDNFYKTTQGGLGCFALQTTSGNYFGYWDSQPTTATATYSIPGRRRLCACQQ